MRRDDLLIEIGTEELPPKALKSLAESFASGIENGLSKSELNFSTVRWLASPRRLAVIVDQLSEQAADRAVEVQGPPVAAAKDNDGNWSKAADGFARKNGVTPEQLSVVDTDKGPRLAFSQTLRGATIQNAIQTIIQDALAALPIPKRMRWGANRFEFIRPVHTLVIMFGADILGAELFGIKANNLTRGHRFHCDTFLPIANPQVYEKLLAESGHVIADYALRQQRIREQVTACGEKLGGHAVISDDLLDEVTSLVEWPVAVAGSFEQRFLAVPPEALIASMKEHQKYFHVVDANGNLMPHFITVANIESTDAAQVISGNERVIRPRLSDAAFFYETDKKSTLASRVEKLKSIVFQDKLGTLFDKTQRVAALAGYIAEHIGGDKISAERAGQLSKTDLLSEIVLEFDNMQGLAGYYYALNDGENEDVAIALKEQYLPRFAGDSLPGGSTGSALALADRIDTIVGIFGIGQPPTGSKDPFALRRASLGVLRILVEKNYPLDLRELLQRAAQNYAAVLNDPAATVDQVLQYMLERFRARYEDDGISAEVFMAVHAKGLTQPLDIHQRVLAVHAFSQLPEAAALAAANKRVTNLLEKSGDTRISTVHSELLIETAEKLLAEKLSGMRELVEPLFSAAKYQDGLQQLASLRDSIDLFFDQVMVMVDDDALKNNRLALLYDLRALFLQVADISLLVPAK